MEEKRDKIGLKYILLKGQFKRFVFELMTLVLHDISAWICQR